MAKRNRFTGVCFCAALLFAAAGVARAQENAPPDEKTAPSSQPPLVVRVILNNEPISPATARYFERAIREAGQSNAELLVVELDTPGGLVDSTRAIVKDILASRVPVAIYVAPSGARAASAGVFITMAGHVAAMAPGTNIGAAHPVQMGGMPMGPSQPESPENETASDDDDETTGTAKSAGSPMDEKIMNDMKAWARSLAELRGRNAEWAISAIEESVSATASEALELNVIDVVAPSLADLLEQIDGREVEAAGAAVRLDTARVEIRTVEMWWGERLLAMIANPNVAFILLIFGFYGILFELYSPGWGVGGTLGIVCLLLAFFALSVLPVNALGLVLILVAIALFVAEAFVTSFGALALGGTVCLVLGGLMLIDSPTGFMRVSLAVVLPVAGATALIAVFLIAGIVRSFRSRVQTGSEAMAGKSGVAAGAFAGEGGRFAGTVRAFGEFWTAESREPVADGQEVVIEDREGMKLKVRPAGEAEAANAPPEKKRVP